MRHKGNKLAILLAVSASLFLAGCGQRGDEPAKQEEMQKEDTEVLALDGTPLKGGNLLSRSGARGLLKIEDIKLLLEEGAESGGTGTEEKELGHGLVLASEDWGLGFGEEGSQPTGNASPSDLKAYDAYFVGDASEKVIYLTFDCGYENGNTEPILDALKKHKAPATFFVVGHYLESAPDLVKRMVEEGHAVGNHTYHHLDMPSISKMEEFQKEMDDVAELFHEITGRDLSMYYRPPQGKCNEANLRMAQELGYSTVFWSLAHVDWIQDDQPSHSEAMEKLTKRIHPGAVVLLHNTSRTNGEILDELLTKWEEMGYTFKPLSDLVGK